MPHMKPSLMLLCTYVNKWARAGPDAMTLLRIPYARETSQMNVATIVAADCTCCAATDTDDVDAKRSAGLRPGAQCGDWTRAGHGCVDVTDELGRPLRGGLLHSVSVAFTQRTTQLIRAIRPSLCSWRELRFCLESNLTSPIIPAESQA